MTEHKQRWGIGAVVVFASILHALFLSDNWNIASSEEHGRDFASFYYATQAASLDQNPYNPDLLNQLASQDGSRARVYPYFYPPPFLAILHIFEK